MERSGLQNKKVWRERVNGQRITNKWNESVHKAVVVRPKVIPRSKRKSDDNIHHN